MNEETWQVADSWELMQMMSCMRTEKLQHNNCTQYVNHVLLECDLFKFRVFSLFSSILFADCEMSCLFWVLILVLCWAFEEDILALLCHCSSTACESICTKAEDVHVFKMSVFYLLVFYLLFLHFSTGIWWRMIPGIYPWAQILWSQKLKPGRIEMLGAVYSNLPCETL